MTKIWGGQFALASPTPHSGGLVPRVLPVIYAHAHKSNDCNKITQKTTWDKWETPTPLLLLAYCYRLLLLSLWMRLSLVLDGVEQRTVLCDRLRRVRTWNILQGSGSCLFPELAVFKSSRQREIMHSTRLVISVTSRKLVALSVTTGWPKINGTIFCVRLNSSNINRFSKLPLSLKIPSYLNCVATLPCEMSSVLKATIENKTTSVTTHYTC